MKLLLPLGLLGLLGIVALIIIYIIKPNFQQKLISSTFIWRLSLKYRKRKIPFSRLRNILLILCQVLIITAAALILAKPVSILKEKIKEPEVILIIDSSASMRAADVDETRYERAVRSAIDEANRIFDNGGIVSVILAEEKASYLVERAAADSRDAVVQEMETLLDDESSCSYGSADLKAAVAKSDQVLQINPSAKVYLYTDTAISYVPDNIGYVNVSEKEEWNAAILNATAKLEDNYYTFAIDVACYGRDLDLDVTLEIFGANAEDSRDISAGTVTLTETVPCAGDQITTLIFKYLPDEEIDAYESTLPDNCVLHPVDQASRVFSYQSVHISIEEEDSLALDNNFDIYGGLKQVLKVQYFSAGSDPATGASLGPNIFFQEALASIKKNYADRWDIQITEVKKGNPYETEGYDFYIFEHTMPDTLPTDGAVLLADPIGAPATFGVHYESVIDMSKRSVYLAAEESHPILDSMTPTNITVSRYVKFSYYDPAYTMLLSYAGDPMLLVKNDGESRVAIMCFSLHYSNLPMLVDFPLLVHHIFDYFLPATVIGNSFETYESIPLNCQSDALNIKGYNVDMTLEEFPATVALETPGSYTLSQTTYAGKDITETIYVKMPAVESNIRAELDSVESPYYEVDESDYYNDLLMYLAIALVVLLTLEWYLQHKESSI